LAVTISLHNIPEGLAVAVPIAYTTRSRFWTIAIPFLTGLFEPLGAIAAGLFLHPFITDQRSHSHDPRSASTRTRAHTIV
jgi:ZIP family zinc transporter